MKFIAIFQSDFNVGGIQKSLLNLLNNLDYERVGVDLFLFSVPSTDLKIPSQVNLIIKKPLPKLMRLLPFGLLRKIYRESMSKKKYDIAIDYNGYWPECAIGAQSVHSQKCVMWIHSDIKKRLELNSRYRLLWSVSKSKLKGFQQFVAVSQGCAASFAEVYQQDVPVLVIPNIVNVDEINFMKNDPIELELDPTTTNFISVGRLTPHKGFDDLIRYFSEAIKQRPDIRLYIVGDGSYRSVLQELISNLNLKNRVIMLGSLNNPYSVMNRMDAFIFASRYEGQAIVINEAQVLGLPVIIPKSLEPFNVDVIGTDDMVDSMIRFEKGHVIQTELKEYHDEISIAISELMGTCVTGTELI